MRLFDVGYFIILNILIPLLSYLHKLLLLYIFYMSIVLRYSQVLIWVFCFFAIESSYAQSQELRFKHISFDNGLSSNQINCIIQDSDGFMWFGTDEGLNRFDGYEVIAYKKTIANSNSLCDDQVVCLYVDSKSRLWVGTTNGISMYNEIGDNFKNYCPKDSGRKSDAKVKITNIYEDRSKNILFCTENGEVYKIENENFIKVINGNNEVKIKCNIQDKEGNFWFGDINGITFRDKQTGETKKIKSISKYESIDNVNCLFEDNGIIWAGTNSGQIVQINKRTFEIKEVKIPGETLGFIFDIEKDKNGYMYVATSEGLFVFNKNQNKYFEYHHELNNPFGLNSESITYVYIDKTNNVWLGTLQGGVNYSMVNKHFSNYNLFSKPLQIDVSGVQSLCIDSKGNWWLGSYKGINLINPKSGARKIFLPNESNPNAISKGSVMHIFEDSKKRIWIGTYMGYLQEYIPSGNYFKTYTFSHLNTGGKKVFDIRSMCEDSAGNFWLISHSAGLVYYNPNKGKVKFYSDNYSKSKTSLTDNFAYQILQQKNSDFLWIGTPTGILKFNTKTEKFRSYKIKENDSTSLSSNLINTIFIDSEDNIWVGTLFGLNLYNKKTDSFYQYYVTDGLPSNQIKSIIEEKPGKLWMGTGYGLTCMQFKHINYDVKPKLSFRNYDKGDNLQDAFFWKRSVAKDNSGQLFFGTEKGLIAFYPSQIADNTKAPKVFLTELLIFNNKIQIGAKDSILPQNIKSTSRINLQHDHKIITFKYVAVNYLAPEKIQYAYKMEGFDKDWNYVGNKQEATYTNLDPGLYKFRVIASNNDGYWNRTGCAIEITIQPPFWKSWWFRICLILMIAAAIIAFYYFRFSFYRKQQAKLTKMVIDRTLDLQEITANMEERQEEIRQQNEELSSQRDALSEANSLLSKQKQQILQQNSELYQHRNELELLVAQRTHELLIAKEKAEESDKLKSSFLANLSHEIRTPLNAIIGFSSIIADDDVEAQERSVYKQIIQNNGFSLLSLIDDIIDFSKIEAGYINIVIKNIPLKNVLENVNQIYNFQIKRQLSSAEKKIDFKIITADDTNSLTLKTDETRLSQILTNLINNAIKFTSQGFIEVGYQVINRNQSIQFYVKDSGIGIKKEHQKIIFERFRKIEENENQIHRGAGLGLAISYQLVSLLGGSIWVESEENKGATFYFTIPLANKEEVGKVPLVTVNSSDYLNNLPNLQNHTIIIAEDDQANFAYIHKLIERTKASVIRAETGLQVLNLLENLHENISIILMDIKMPELDGIETLKEIRRRNIQIPILAQTAHVFSDEIRQLKDVGFDEYISKPINAAELYNKINKLLNLGV